MGWVVANNYDTIFRNMPISSEAPIMGMKCGGGGSSSIRPARLRVIARRSRLFSMIEVRTSEKTEPSAQPTGDPAENWSKSAKASRADPDGGLRYHSIELCREGEKDPPPPRGGGRGRVEESIGSLSCATLVYTEKNWKSEVSVRRRVE